MSFRTPSLGALNTRITLFTRTETIEASGGKEISFTQLATVWAQLNWPSARLSDFASGAAAAQSVEAIIRFRGDINPGDRIAIEGTPYDVTHVADPNGRRAYLVVHAERSDQIGGRYD
jgi:SPP1 family predicted phage head-tail adaptor